MQHNKIKNLLNYYYLHNKKLLVVWRPFADTEFWNLWDDIYEYELCYNRRHGNADKHHGRSIFLHFPVTFWRVIY
jgi:hypothetical protein